MKRLFAIFLMCVMLLGLCSCGLFTNPEEEKEKAQEKENNLYASLFSPDSVIKIDIDITTAELYKMQKDYENAGKSPDVFRKCNVTIDVNGEKHTINDTGIRMRGNTSATDFCGGNGKVYNYIHYRLSFDQTFDDTLKYTEEERTTWNAAKRIERKARKFAGMTAVNLKWNKNYDNTYIRDIYASNMFKANGVLAQSSTLAQVSISQPSNGSYSQESLGVYLLQEAIDKSFIERNFSKEEQGGDLYKCGFGVDLTDTSSREYELKTNELTSDGSHLTNFISKLNSLNKSASDFKSQLESIIDMNEFIAFEAVNYFIGNPDCTRNYTNNLYLYFKPDGKAVFIAYDSDRCFGIARDWNPSKNGMTTATPFQTTSASWENREIRNPLYRKTILAGGHSEYMQAFKTKLLSVADSDWMKYTNFTSLYSKYQENYASLITPSDTIKTQCKDNIEFARFVFNLDGEAATYRQQVNNISTKNYFDAKLATFWASVNDINIASSNEITVYFDTNNKFDTLYVYSWGGNSGGGREDSPMIDFEGTGLWYITLPSNITGLLFYTGNFSPDGNFDETNQTVNLVTGTPNETEFQLKVENNAIYKPTESFRTATKNKYKLEKIGMA